MITNITYNDTSNGVHRQSAIGNFAAEYQEELLPAITEGEEGINVVFLRLTSGNDLLAIHQMFGADKLSYDERKAVLTLLFEDLDSKIQSENGYKCDLSVMYESALTIVRNK